MHTPQQPTDSSSDSNPSCPSRAITAGAPSPRCHSAQMVRCGGLGLLPGALMIFAAFSFTQDPQAAHAMRAELAQMRVGYTELAPEPTMPAPQHVSNAMASERTPLKNPAPVPGLVD